MGNDSGTVIVEYVVVLSTVALGFAMALAALGAPLVSFLRLQAVWVGLPFP
jgi:hypothetical protein